MVSGGPRFQVSGLGNQVPGSGVQARVQVQEIGHRYSHLSSIQPSIGISHPPTANR